MPSPSIAKLNDSNYTEWVVGMRATLIRRGLWEVVERSETDTRPNGSDNTKAVRSWRAKRQEAQAELLLHVEPSQYPHVADEDDPYAAWEALRSVHQSRGFATRNTLHRNFMRMTKRNDQPMSAWVADVRRAAYNLRAIAPSMVSDSDIISVLTGGLPSSYAPFVVTLDSTPESLLTLEYAITRLLNEEARQSCVTPRSNALRTAAVSNSDEALSAQDAPATKTKVATPIERITCFRCQAKGHYARTCTAPAPAPRTEAANQARASTNEAW